MVGPFVPPVVVWHLLVFTWGSGVRVISVPTQSAEQCEKARLRILKLNNGFSSRIDAMCVEGTR